MDQQEVTDLISATAVLMEQFERSCRDIENRQHALSKQLQGLAEQLPATVRQSADASLQGLPGALLGKVQSGLDQPVGEYQKRLREAGAQIGSGARSLDLQLQRMEQLHKRLIWKTTAVLIGSLSLLLVGTLWLSMHYAGVIRDNQVAADKLKAINSADIVFCGGRLCAQVDHQSKGYGDKGQYQPIKQR